MPLRRGFVLRFEAAAHERAHEAAAAFRARLDEAAAPHARVEAGGGRALPGTLGGRHGMSMSVGVRDDDGEPRWLAPITVRDEPAGAAEDALAFLQRWGFLPRVRSDSRIS